MNPTTLCCFLMAAIVTLTITIMPAAYAYAEPDAFHGPCPKIPGKIIKC
nr:U6_MYRTX_Ta1a [Tetramorium africanum]